MHDQSIGGDTISAVMERPRGVEDEGFAIGTVVAELFDEHGNLKAREVVHNLITSAGDNVYIARGGGVSGAPAAPTGMRIGTGSTAPAKSGAGAAIVTKITAGNKAFDATYPQAAANVTTYRTTYAPGEGTTASPVTEVVIVNDTIATDTATAAANTISRALLTGIGSKGAADTLVITWTHTFTGA